MSDRYVLMRPGEALDWSFDWSAYLPEGIAIASRQWAVTPAGPTLTNDTGEAVRVSGLAAGQIYVLSQAATLSSGEVAVQAITIRCEQP